LKDKGGIMRPIQYGKWMVDLENCTCWNTENEVVIIFEKIGTTVLGKFKKIPIKLAQELMKDPNSKKYVKEVAVEADKVFFNAYFANENDRF
jgi:hypothetical protein